MRRDDLQKSNDSYSLANPAQRLEGCSQIIGADENRPQGFRARLGITQIRDRQAGSGGLPGAGCGRQWLQDLLYGNRHGSAEIMLDGVLPTCATQNTTATIGGQAVNVAPACTVRAAWDRRNHIASVGTRVCTELWRRLSGAPALDEVAECNGASLPEELETHAVGRVLRAAARGLLVVLWADADRDAGIRVALVARGLAHAVGDDAAFLRGRRHHGAARAHAEPRF
jgi:hypothetical protein